MTGGSPDSRVRVSAPVTLVLGSRVPADATLAARQRCQTRT
ncbi:hypothetical protein [Micromonospora cathayae]|uniref:Uncharacterized protein n=1 Tax=Micromonospora cathayae TaxID=3028804 RepID=A0ABY7ZVF0_9ACTN|nr:hypothetical protein [Micromonospora sp. HUAS 3]WDZ87035.1 hypothetical protein PVK37_11840 [Micromonospora sp. HUAS 3]